MRVITSHPLKCLSRINSLILTTSQVLYFGNATFPVSYALIKLALLFQYLRVFDRGSRTRLFCKYMIAITAAWGIAFTILRWVPCYPVSSYWDASVRNSHCWGFGSRDFQAFARVFVGQASSSALLDLTIFAIPLPLCFKPGTPRKTRLCLVGLFFLGLLCVVTSPFFFPPQLSPRRC